MEDQGTAFHGEMSFLPRGAVGSSPASGSPPIPSPPSAAAGAGINGGPNYILHTVSKFDTLAGVAIKYGVEVADIKRLNGLVTDLQMFALKTLQIPLPGRHPPSPSLHNINDSSLRPRITTEQARRHSDFFDSFQSLKLKSTMVSSATTSNLQTYYDDGLRKTDKEYVHQNGGGSFSTTPLSSPRSLGHHGKSRSAANSLMLASDGSKLNSPLLSKNLIPSDKWIAKMFRRRQKSEAIHLGDNDEKSSFIRKSSSTSSLPEDSSSPMSSIWGLKPDFQAISTTAITKPIMNWMNKAALD